MIWASVCWNASTSGPTLGRTSANNAGSVNDAATSPVRLNGDDTDDNDDSQHSLRSSGVSPMSATRGLADAHVGPLSSLQQLPPTLPEGVDAAAVAAAGTSAGPPGGPLTKVTVEEANLLLSLQSSRNSSRASTETQPPNMPL